jgi:hypothetical protein
MLMTRITELQQHKLICHSDQRINNVELTGSASAATTVTIKSLLRVATAAFVDWECQGYE